ncbi:RHS repeat domain-containing protein [Paraburkholderia humisilvae]|uniref:RHS repeat domain-containing protein n=1 Tax=Paraburkholderia humisilvae TaxID=627669 RepID=UPI001FE98484|nr:RHS repeat domain-containing protein [Paraburkholderia humisilvae]
MYPKRVGNVPSVSPNGPYPWPLVVAPVLLATATTLPCWFAYSQLFGDGSQTITHSYDGLGQLTQTSAAGRTLRYTHDAAGNVTDIARFAVLSRLSRS